MPSWPIQTAEWNSIVDEAWKLAIEAQDRQQALAGAPFGTTSACQLSGGPSRKIDPQTREAVSVYAVFCSFIGLKMVTQEIYIVKTKDSYHSRVFGRWSSSNYCEYLSVGLSNRD